MGPSGQKISMAALAACAYASVSVSNDAFVISPGAQKEAPARQQLRGLSSSTLSVTTPQSSFGLTSLGLALGAAGLAASVKRLQPKEACGRKGAGVTRLHAFENELGVQAPMGFWDPLGFTADGDVEAFKRRREVEIKNGRVAMFATIGYIVPEYFKFPGYIAPSINLKFEDIPNGLGAIGKVPSEGWIQWVALCGLYETVVNGESDPNEPGNYGKGRLGYGNMVAGIEGQSIEDPEARKRGLNSEIANGRLAMMAITGMWFQDGLTGSAWGDWGNYVDSPLR